MSAPISDASRAVIIQLMDGADDGERRTALEQLPSLPDKEHVADFLAARLRTEEDGWRRSWAVSALGAINRPDTADVVAAHLDPQKEDFEWTRYWAAIALAKMQPPDLKKHLIKALRDDSPLVHAVALRLLIEAGFEDKYTDALESLMKDPAWDIRLFACKALRRAAGHRALREDVEARFIPRLRERLLDPNESIDCRFQAAMALGDIEHKWREALRALAQALEEGLPDDWARRACVDSLRRIGKPETREPLLLALRDTDAEIRVRAADTLKETLGVEEAVAFIVEHMLRQEQPLRQYLDALIRTDHKAAGDTLRDYLFHPDPAVASRAQRALTELGGEEAVRALHALRREVMAEYTKLLGDADQKVMAQFESLMQRARWAFVMSMSMHGIIFAIGVIALAVSLYVALSEGFQTFERYVGVGTAAGSLGTLLLLFYRGPLRDIRDSVTTLVKVNVVFLGYVRQINQIDATFKQMFLGTGGFGIEAMAKTVMEIRSAVQQTMDQVKTSLAGGPDR